MKGDFSRNTFVPQRHYRGVLMQQGRVQVDADWNEQQALQQHLDETMTRDVVGLCGVPEDTLHGFELTENGKTLGIGAGRIYVDGILCVNERPVTYNRQPHRPAPLSLVDDMTRAPAFPLADLARDQFGGLKQEEADQVPDKFALVYLDVWERGVTALDDAHIREQALNGPDTAARRQTVWQVRVLPLPPTELAPERKPDLIKVLLEIGKTAGHIVKGAPTGRDVLNVLNVRQTCRGEWPGWQARIEGSTGSMLAQAVAPAGDDNNPCLVPAGGGFRRLENQLYRVEIHRGGNEKTATYKWSRENGSVAVRWVGQSGSKHEILEIEGPNPDAVLGFTAGQWVELTDDRYELEGLPGDLVQLGAPDGTRLTVNPDSLPSGTVPLLSKYPNHAKIRRWETNTLNQADKPERKLNTPGPVELEDGIQVQFSEGTYHTGDYWLIPGRTTGGQIEWPGRKDGEIYWPPYPEGVEPSYEPPAGIQRHYYPLAIIYLDTTERVHLVEDCRAVFPPLAGLVDMFYAGGDGQTARANSTGVGKFHALDLPLRVQVLGSTGPIEGAVVVFRTDDGGDLKGRLADLAAASPAQPCEFRATTGRDGVAQCYWQLFDEQASQRVEARLESVPCDERIIPRAILFHAQFGKASEVAYYPKEGCAAFLGMNTVEAALDRLTTQVHLAYIGGTGQVALLTTDETRSHIPLPQPLYIQIVSPCGPVQGAKVSFQAADGLVATEENGAGVALLELQTNAQGMAWCYWQLSADPGKTRQKVDAWLTTFPEGMTIGRPRNIEFNATLVPVHEEGGEGGGCCVTVAPEKMSDVIGQLAAKKQQNISVCLDVTKAGSKVEPLDLDGKEIQFSLTIHGCGKALPVNWSAWSLKQLSLFRLDGVSVNGVEPTIFTFTDCREVVIEGCTLTGALGSQQPAVRIDGGMLIQLRKNVVRAPLVEKPMDPKGILDGLTTVAIGGAFEGRAGERRTQRVKASQGLAALSATQKRQFVTNLKKRVEQAGARLSPVEVSAYSALAEQVNAAQPDWNAIEGALAAVDSASTHAVQGEGPAIALNCVDAQVYILDNVIGGILYVYQQGANAFFDSSQYKGLAANFKEGKISLASEGGGLHLRGNNLYALDGAGIHAQRLSDGGIVDGLFNAIYLIGNRLYAHVRPALTNLPKLPLLALASQVTLTGNSVDATEGTLAGAIVANSASYTGNTAVPAVSLLDLSLFNQNSANQAANSGLSISPM